MKRIVCNPQILVGKPTIEGTRLSVEFVLEHIGYHSIEEMLDQFPTLTLDGIHAALEYAAAVFRLEKPLPVYKETDNENHTITINRGDAPVIVHTLNNS
jgi:uncharacterized protein (DUF433 family)